MAFKFYSRFSAADFQRYKDFFPKFDSDNLTDGVKRRSCSEFCEASEPGASEWRSENGRAADEVQTPLPICDHNYNNWNGIARSSFVTSFKEGSACSSLPPLAESSPLPSPTPSTSSTVNSSSSSSSSSWSSELQLSSASASESSATSSSSTSSSLSKRAKSRKPARPKRSPKRNDPKFKGVTFSVETAFAKGKLKPTTQLHIRSYFSIRRCRRLLARRSASRWRCLSRGDRFSMAARLEPDSSSSAAEDETETKAFSGRVSTRMASSTRLADSSMPASVSSVGRDASNSSTIAACKGQGKQCESCKTRRTPLWRDAEDGTPLCNACGIRYKKYRIRCPFCWLIPRKDSKTFPHCGRCGVLLRMTLPRRTHFI